MRVRSDFNPGRMTHFNDCLDFLRRHFRRTMDASESQYSAGSNDLQDISTAGDGLFRIATKLIRST